MTRRDHLNLSTMSLRYSLMLCAMGALIACRNSDAPPTSEKVSVPEFAPTAALLAPAPSALTAAAPDSFHLVFVTSQGEIEVVVQRAWAPHGVDRLYYLATNHFFTGMRFYRVQRDLLAQFGLTGSSAVNATFDTLKIQDDSLVISNTRGTLAFASMGSHTRTTELFFNLRDNPRFDGDGLVPLARVVRGEEVLPRLFSQHGQGLAREKIVTDGNAYLDGFPLLDFIVSATVKP